MTLTVNLTPYPAPAEPKLSVSWDEPHITINGETIDLSPVNPGDTRRNPDHALRKVERDSDGNYTVEIRMPYGNSAPEETRFPEPVTVESGDVPTPPFDHREADQ